MSQPIPISDELVFDAKATAAVCKRSIADQIELWAQLGRVIEPLLDGSRGAAAQKPAGETSLWERLSTVDSPEGRRRLADYLDSRPFPHFEAASGGGDLLVRIDADGTRTVGRFVGREFRPIE